MSRVGAIAAKTENAAEAGMKVRLTLVDATTGLSTERIAIFDLAPLLAVIGAAGFVVAFALQGALGALASDLPIRFNKPLDIGDKVAVGGVKDRAEDVTIFSTLIQTGENTRMIAPRWSDAFHTR